MARLLSLPDNSLELIIQHVPLRDRLTSCCLVHSKLHAAAVSGEAALNLAAFPPVTSPERAQSVLGWLDQYGEHLTSLKMNKFPQPLLQLPCPNLLELSLGEGCCVQLAPSAAADGSPGVIQHCSKLTRLELQCNFTDSPKQEGLDPVLDSLSSLVDLHRLVLSPTGRDTTALAGSSLPPFPHLTSLTVSCMDVGFLDNLSHSSNLRELSVLSSPSGITLGPFTMPDLELPDSLTKLSLQCRIQTGLLSLVPATLRELYIDGGVEGHADALLFGIGRLQHLTTLVLDTLEGLGDWPPPGPAYNAITGSSSLVSLGLEDLKLPEGVLPYVFPTTHKLQHLTSVSIQDFVAPAAEGAGAGAARTWGPADLSSLIECCPNLASIDKVFLQTGPHMSELHKVTALTRLDVVFVPGGLPAYEESLQGLAAITQLQELAFQMTRNNLTVGSLLPLTSLTALTSLSCEWEASASPMAPAGQDPTGAVEDTRVAFTSQGDCVLPVWVRLLLRCSGCNPQALSQLKQQLSGPDAAAVHRGVTFDQQQQLSVHHQRLSTQRQYIVKHGQQIEDLQERLAIQGRVTAQQTEQITTLNAQSATHHQVLITAQQVVAQQVARIRGLGDQLTAQRQAAEQQQQRAAQHDARIATLQGQLDAQVQTATQRHQLLMGQQQHQLATQRMVMGYQSRQITALEGQLQAMQAMLQEVLQRQQQQQHRQQEQ